MAGTRTVPKQKEEQEEEQNGESEQSEKQSAEEKLEAKLVQAAAENEELQRRISQLGGYQNEVAKLRDQVEILTEDIVSITAERDAATKDASEARAALKDAGAKGS